MADSKKTVEVGPVAAVHANDGIAFIRNLRPIRHQDIPAVDEHFKPLPAAVKQPLLRMPEDQRAEVTQGLQVLIANPRQLVEDLGPFAPDSGKAEALLARFEEDRLVRDRAVTLAAFAEEREDVTNHDVMTFLNETQKDLERLVEKKPALAARYNSILKIKAQRGAAISEGLARKKAEAAAGGQEEPGGGGK